MVSAQESLKPKYPIYIPSKGRWESRITVKTFEALDVPYRIVVEPQEYAEYSAVIAPENILTLPFSNLGLGSIPARNWIWEHSLSEGHSRHWIVDDNIGHFYEWQDHKRIRMKDASAILFAEAYIDRYENVALAGFQYQFEGRVGPTERRSLPFQLNSRIYSFICIQNAIPFRWRGRYNEDTDLSLRVLKAGLCTILFGKWVCGKKATMTMKGGNTDSLYIKTEDFDGRLEMAKSLMRQHPDVVKITRKWGRWQHQVDYRPFKCNKLKLKAMHGTPAETDR